MGALENLADALTHLRNDLLRGHPAPVLVVALACDHEAVPRVEQFVPVNAADLGAEHRRRLGGHLPYDPQDATRRPQLQVQLVDESLASLEGDRAVGRNDAPCAQGLKLENQGWLGFFRTGGDQLHSMSMTRRTEFPGLGRRTGDDVFRPGMVPRKQHAAERSADGTLRQRHEYQSGRLSLFSKAV